MSLGDAWVRLLERKQNDVLHMVIQLVKLLLLGTEIFTSKRFHLICKRS
jgi:hypothetical protein